MADFIPPGNDCPPCNCSGHCQGHEGLGDEHYCRVHGLRSQVREWLACAPDEVKRMFAGSINVLNFWRDERNRNFQMVGAYDGSISDECRALCREDFEVCNTIIDWSAALADELGGGE